MLTNKRTRFHNTLRFTDRYGMATTAKYDEHCYNGNIDVRKQEIAEAVRNGDLQSFPLYGNVKYYTIGPNAAKNYSVKSRTGPNGYGPEVLPKYSAIFDYCTSEKPLRSRFLFKKAEFISAFPDLVEGLANFRDRYMFEVDESGAPQRLATFVVDASIKLRTLISKVRKITIRRNANKCFRTLQDEGAFVVLIITHSNDRATDITNALTHLRRKQPIALTKVVVSQLLMEVIGNV